MKLLSLVKQNNLVPLSRKDPATTTSFNLSFPLVILTSITLKAMVDVTGEVSLTSIL